MYLAALYQIFSKSMLRIQIFIDFWKVIRNILPLVPNFSIYTIWNWCALSTEFLNFFEYITRPFSNFWGNLSWSIWLLALFNEKFILHVSILLQNKQFSLSWPPRCLPYTKPELTFGLIWFYIFILTRDPFWLFICHAAPDLGRHNYL